MVLFLAYNKKHLEWIQNFRNALFSNDPKFYEEYLRCFSSRNHGETSSIINLKEKLEEHYKTKFCLDCEYYYFDSIGYPNFKRKGNFGELKFSGISYENYS